MISSSDVPACPACGSREVHPITKPAIQETIAQAALRLGLHKHPTPEPEPEAFVTFFACRQCGRDVTDAWIDIQPAPKPEPVIGPPPDPIETESIAETAIRLGIAATNGASS